MSETTFSIGDHNFVYTNEQTQAAAANLYDNGVARQDHTFHSLSKQVDELALKHEWPLHYAVIVLDAFMKLIEQGKLELPVESALPVITFR